MTMKQHQHLSLLFVAIATLVNPRGSRLCHAYLLPHQESQGTKSFIKTPIWQLTKPKTASIDEKKKKSTSIALPQPSTTTGNGRVDERKSDRIAPKRKKWGIDKDDESDEYWFNSKIHTFGNTGIGGGLHAALAPLATKMIDMMAYRGEDVRDMVAHDLNKLIQRSKNYKARVADLCCGVGISTRALQNAFPDAEKVIGIDTSPEMISMARAISMHEKTVAPLIQAIYNFFRTIDLLLHTHSRAIHNAYKDVTNKCIATFTNGNAEDTQLPGRSFDLVTIMYGFHEAPRQGRAKMLYEARRLLRDGGLLALVDISPDYQPSPTMLAGEPYVLEYQENINKQLRSVHGFTRVMFKSIVPGHVGLWLLRRE